MTNNVVFYLYNRFGDNMKRVFIISIILGIIFSLILYLNYKKNLNDIDSKVTLYFFQVSAYKNIENVSNKTKNLNSYLVIKESDNLYHIYIALTKNLENFKKIKELYEKNGDNIYVREKIVGCEKFILELDNYEVLISKVESKEAVERIQKDVLKKYKDYNCENIRNG
jgi:hypothetical protein